jgi:hypothetical protein
MSGGEDALRRQDAPRRRRVREELRPVALQRQAEPEGFTARADDRPPGVAVLRHRADDVEHPAFADARLPARRRDLVRDAARLRDLDRHAIGVDVPERPDAAVVVRGRFRGGLDARRPGMVRRANSRTRLSKAFTDPLRPTTCP